jgi:hypothetical protein
MPPLASVAFVGNVLINAGAYAGDRGFRGALRINRRACTRPFHDSAFVLKVLEGSRARGRPDVLSVGWQ